MASFEKWMERVNANLMSIAGVDALDLPDIDYRDLYDGEASPNEAAMEALKYAGWRG